MSSSSSAASVSLQSDVQYFHNLVNLIPPQHYIHADNEDDDEAWAKSRFAKKKAGVKSHKVGKRPRSQQVDEKLDAHASQDTVSAIANGGSSSVPKAHVTAEQAERKKAKKEAKKEAKKKGLLGGILLSKDSVKREELQAQLRERIERLAQKRKHNNEVVGKKRKHDKTAGASSQKKNKKRKTVVGGGSKAGVVVAEQAPKLQQQQQQQPSSKVPIALQFGQVRLGDEVEAVSSSKKRKLSAKEQLAEAEREQERRAQLAKEGRNDVLLDDAWKRAAKRAKGETVKDDVGRLRKAVRDKERQKRRSAEQWQERLEKVEKQVESRQAKRQENIEKKIQRRKERTVRKLTGAKKPKPAKRPPPKKANRAGFEGRKTKKLN